MKKLNPFLVKSTYTVYSSYPDNYVGILVGVFWVVLVWFVFGLVVTTKAVDLKECEGSGYLHVTRNIL